MASFYLEGDALWCGDHKIATFIEAQPRKNRNSLVKMLNNYDLLVASCRLGAGINPFGDVQNVNARDACRIALAKLPKKGNANAK